MAASSILQVAVSGRPVRERIAGKVAQLTGAPSRLARELGLVLQRAKSSITHGAAVVEDVAGPAAEARVDAVLALEASRTSPLTHAEDGVTVVTVVAVGPAPLWNAPNVEACVQALAGVPDGALTRVAVHLAPEDGQSFDVSALAQGYPHLAPLALGAAGQVRCRFCGVTFEAYRTSCPSCGGAVER